ncbi:MAG: hypothetical protein Q4C61_04110 [Lachnospiraceae bacterium]|nr:hypothetical protein [Lachnospiraceae bacterium]
MSVLRGCQEGKTTPKMVEVKCPKCGEMIEVFVKMGGALGESGTLAADEKCPGCDFVAEEGTPVASFEQP